jgi:sulfite exporter TauE/SafE
MALFLSMLPFYILGNLHCFGMCGPLAFYLASSPYRAYYLFGRIFSFTLAGWAAGALGEGIHLFLKKGPWPALFSASMGVGLFLSAFTYFSCFKPLLAFLERGRRPVEKRIAGWLVIQEPWPLFLIGASTIFLPCGQTLLVYSACALSGSGLLGLGNGLGFALLTTPSLLLAMQSRKIAAKKLDKWQFALPLGFAVIGAIAILRGLAEAGWISHFGVPPFMLY